MREKKMKLTLENYKNELGVNNTDDIDFFQIITKYKLSEEFIEKFLDSINLEILFMRQELSEKFIQKHQKHFACFLLCSPN